MRLRKILMYDVSRTLFDLFNFTERREGKIFVLSVVYVCFIIIMTYWLVRLAMFSYPMAMIVYLFSTLASAILLNNSSRRYILFLNKRPDSIMTRILHIVTGPYGILKILYIVICLGVLTHHSNKVTELIFTVPADRFSRQDRADYPIVSSIVKYQKRLKDCS